jgi:hypothetical protein
MRALFGAVDVLVTMVGWCGMDSALIWGNGAGL